MQRDFNVQSLTFHDINAEHTEYCRSIRWYSQKTSRKYVTAV